MKITDETLKYISSLSKISIDENEKEDYKKELSKIISYMDALNEVDTEKIDFTHILKNKNVFREDVPKESTEHNEMLKNAPCENGCFKVPKVME